MGMTMGIKKVVKYSVGMAVAGIAAYELARMMKKPSTRGERMQTREYTPPEERYERMETPEYRPQEPSDPRDYRSIYHL